MIQCLSPLLLRYLLDHLVVDLGQRYVEVYHKQSQVVLPLFLLQLVPQGITPLLRLYCRATGAAAGLSAVRPLTHSYTLGAT